MESIRTQKLYQLTKYNINHAEIGQGLDRLEYDAEMLHSMNHTYPRSTVQGIWGLRHVLKNSL